MRLGQERSLQATAQAIATVLAAEDTLLYPNPGRRTEEANERSLYAYPATRAVDIDGYISGSDDGWNTVEGRLFSGGANSSLAVTYKAQTYGDTLYVMLQVTDPNLVYYNPGLAGPNGDRLVIRLWYDGRPQDYVIAAIAPGNVRARRLNHRQSGIHATDIQGHWQDSQNGYTIELQIPLVYTGGRLGFYVLNDAPSSAAPDTAGNIQANDLSAPPWLIYSPARLQQLLDSFLGQNDRIQVVDKDHWSIADVMTSDTPRAADNDTFWLLRLMYRSILSNDSLMTLPQDSQPGRLRGEEIDSALAGDAATERYSDPD